MPIMKQFSLKVLNLKGQIICSFSLGAFVPSDSKVPCFKKFIDSVS